jgi:hypothetical protein
MDTTGSASGPATQGSARSSIAILGGVSQRDVAWRRIDFAPILDVPCVNRARVVVPTPTGLIRSAWKRTKAGVRVSLSLPKGVEAKVRLPGISSAATKGRSTYVVDL